VGKPSVTFAPGSMSRSWEALLLPSKRRPPLSLPTCGVASVEDCGVPPGSWKLMFELPEPLASTTASELPPPLPPPEVSSKTNAESCNSPSSLSPNEGVPPGSSRADPTSTASPGPAGRPESAVSRVKGCEGVLPGSSWPPAAVPPALPSTPLVCDACDA